MDKDLKITLNLAGLPSNKNTTDEAAKSLKELKDLVEAYGKAAQRVADSEAARAGVMNSIMQQKLGGMKSAADQAHKLDAINKSNASSTAAWSTQIKIKADEEAKANEIAAKAAAKAGAEAAKQARAQEANNQKLQASYQAIAKSGQKAFSAIISLAKSAVLALAAGSDDNLKYWIRVFAAVESVNRGVTGLVGIYRSLMSVQKQMVAIQQALILKDIQKTATATARRLAEGGSGFSGMTGAMGDAAAKTATAAAPAAAKAGGMAASALGMIIPLIPVIIVAVIALAVAAAIAYALIWMSNNHEKGKQQKFADKASAELKAKERVQEQSDRQDREHEERRGVIDRAGGYRRNAAGVRGIGIDAVSAAASAADDTKPDMTEVNRLKREQAEIRTQADEARSLADPASVQAGLDERNARRAARPRPQSFDQGTGSGFVGAVKVPDRPALEVESDSSKAKRAADLANAKEKDAQAVGMDVEIKAAENEANIKASEAVLRNARETEARARATADLSKKQYESTLEAVANMTAAERARFNTAYAALEAGKKLTMQQIEALDQGKMGDDPRVIEAKRKKFEEVTRDSKGVQDRKATAASDESQAVVNTGRADTLDDELTVKRKEYAAELGKLSEVVAEQMIKFYQEATDAIKQESLFKKADAARVKSIEDLKKWLSEFVAKNNLESK